MQTIIQDLRYGVRMLVKNRLFTFVAIITRALGIGANAAIFSVVNAVLLRSLPYYKADSLIMLWSNTPSGEDDGISPLEAKTSKHVCNRLMTLPAFNRKAST